MSAGPKLHFFAGKGGAGKTLLATAQSLNLLDANGKERVLLVSFEQNGGLADLLKRKLAPKPQKLLPGKGNGGLSVVELELPALGEALAAAWKPKFLASVTRGAALSEDELKKLLEASLTNLGEVAAMFHLLELAESEEWDRVVVDGLSTSHTIRMLDHGANVRRMTALVRGEKLGRPAKSAPARPPLPVDEVAARADALVALLKDPKRFALHVCSIAEPVADGQTRLLVKALTDRAIPMDEIVVDMIEERSESREVANRRGLQAPHVRKYQTLHPKVELVQRRIIGPRGLDEVKKFAKEWSTGKETRALAFLPAEAPPALVRAPSMPPIAAPPLPPTRFIFFVGAGGVGKNSLRRGRRGDAHREGGAGAPHLHRPVAQPVRRAAEPAHRHRDPGEGHQGALRARD